MAERRVRKSQEEWEYREQGKRREVKRDVNLFTLEMWGRGAWGEKGEGTEAKEI